MVNENEKFHVFLAGLGARRRGSEESLVGQRNSKIPRFGFPRRGARGTNAAHGTSGEGGMGEVEENMVGLREGKGKF